MTMQRFQPSSQLTFDTAQKDNERLLVLLRDPAITEIRFDLSEVTQCDSAGLALLIEASRLSIKHKKSLFIDHMPKSIFTLAEFCGVEKILIAYNHAQNSDVVDYANE